MSLNVRDLKDLELQELSDQESNAVTGGNTFGCIVGGAYFAPAFLVNPPLGAGLAYLGCKATSKVEDAID